MTDTARTPTAATQDQGRKDHPAPAKERVSSVALWIGFLLAPLAWSAHTVVATAINGASCITDRDAPPPPGQQIGSAVWIVLLVLSLALVITAIAGLIIAVRSWRSTRPHSREHHELLETGEGRARFMAMAGILVSTVFSLLLLVNTIPVLIAPQCSP